MRRRAWTTAAAVAVLGVMTAVVVAAEDLDRAGRQAYARGDYEEAERLFARAVARAPREPRHRYHWAIALTQLGRWAEAVAEHQRVLQLDPPAAVAAASREALRRLAPAAKPASRVRSRPDESTVRLQRLHGGWVTEVVLSDTRRARFLVDTGASVSVLSPALAETLGLAPGPRSRHVVLQTLAGQTRAPVVMVPSIRVGDIEAHEVVAVVHEIEGGIDGILGNTFLDRFTITVDAERGVLRVRER